MSQSDVDRMNREIYAMEKEIRNLKTKLDNAIIDIRAVNYFGWIYADDMMSREWLPVRHEIQYKRQGCPDWVAIPVVEREDIDPVVPNGEYDYHD